MKKSILTITVTLISISSLFADVRLPAIIGDNMALQQKTNACVWGWADPGEAISIKGSWQWSASNTTADDDGKWKINIKTPKAGGPHKLTIKGKNTIKLKNIIVGEVWLCSGQSNMAMPMEGFTEKQSIHGGSEDIKNATKKSIRLFTVKMATSETPQDDIKGSWVECTPETVKSFSAVGYYFGRKIHQETKNPVGLICSAWGGTMAQAWTRIDFIKYDDNLSPMIDLYNTKLQEWEKACTDAEKEQKTKPNRTFGIRPQDKSASIYNAMIAPITNMTICGTIWYQGESNANAAYLYRVLFPTMIKNWRCDFNNYQMPFYFVQLANYTTHKPGEEIKSYRGEPRDNAWAELREAQLMTCFMKNNGMAVAIDIGETNNIHPGNKKDVGERLALWALAKDYGQKSECSGPLYAGYRIEGNEIRVLFSHAENGLMSKEDTPKGFAIAGEDRKFVWADAKIDGSTVLVSSDQIESPVSVRYAWDIDPETCLYNKENLPASPFRTDNWNSITFGAK